MLFVFFSRILTFRSGPSSGQQLLVKSHDRSHDTKMAAHSSSAVTDPKWCEQGGNSKEVNLEKLEGRNLASKIDMLMAHLSQS